MALDRLTQVTNSGVSTSISFRSTGITVSGIVTATSFVGDGSGLTGVVGSGSGVVIKDDNATVGTAATINFGSNLSVSAISAGVVTVTAADTNTTYTQAAVADGSNVNLRLSGSDSTADDILLTAGTNITFSSVSTGGFTINASGGGGGGTPGGSDTQVQFNDGGSFGGDAGLTYNKTSDTLNVAGGLIVSGVTTSGGINVTTGNEYKINATSVLSSTTLGSSVVNSSLTSLGTLSSGLNIASNQTYKINNTDVLSSTTLGSNVVNSSLTSLGTLGQLNVSGISTFAGITTVTGVTLFAKQINVSGVVTATSFSGDGSALTGIVAQGSGVVVRDSGSVVGTAGTIDFGDNLTVSTLSAGIVTVTGSAGGGTNYWGVNALGIHTTSRVAIGTTGFGSESFAHEDGTLLVQESGAIARVRVRNNNTSASSYSTVNLKTPNAEWSIYTNGATNYLRIYDVLNNSARVHIDSAGNFGIKNTSPTSVLDVTGDAKISSGLQVTGITTLASYAGPVSTWTVTGNGSSYFFSGPGFDGTETNPTLYLVRGQKYRFNGTAGHPIRIQSTPTGTSYDAGVTNNSTATVDFNVQDDAPDVLFYQCTIHSGMRGRIFITGKRIVEGSWTAVAGTLTNIDTITGISTNKFRTAEYTLHFENSASGIQAQKVLVMQDINNATAYSQEYGVMYQPNLLVSVGSSISGGSFFLNATPETGISGVTTYRYTRELIQ